VYRKKTRTAEALQNEIWHAVASISADELQRVSQGFLRKVWCATFHFSFRLLVVLEQGVSSHRIEADISVVFLSTTSRVPLPELTDLS
jgi:hypothetical protein